MNSEAVGRIIQGHRRAQGLTQEQLARKADVPYTTLTKVESGAIKNPSVQFVWKVSRALEISIDTLVEPRVFHGEESTQQIWSDVLETLRTPGDYMCVSGIDESQFLLADSKQLLNFIATLKARGFSQKLLCCEGDTKFLEGDHLEYRAIPKEHFNPTPIYVYGDRIAMLTWGPPQQAIIIQNAVLADAYRKQFLFIWSHAMPVQNGPGKRGTAKRVSAPTGANTKRSAKTGTKGKRPA